GRRMSNAAASLTDLTWLRRLVAQSGLDIRLRMLGVVAASAAGALALALALVAAARGDGLELGVLGLGLVVVCQLGLAARAARPGATRWLLAAVFGLIHGFGFAGALRSAELPRADALRVLLGFNLGVELGQLVVVALLAAVFTALARRGRDGLARALGNAALVGAGVYWFILRALA
ncbi:MAG: HupE/UreJ family protein, partial [Myxococcales bacterium]|nr:HupE/UreJ family protein [Myxococcales bacterium]